MKHDRLREEHIRKTLNQIQSMENMLQKPYYDLSQEQKVDVQIRVDKNVPAAMFKPDPKNPGGWVANELTFRAMKKDIFALGEELQELSERYTCSCQNTMDKQFWHFCPYCGQTFTKL
jgi:hypothetical protein